MAKRERPRLADEQSSEAPPYFVSNDKSVEFIPTGCTALDCALGGGWALGRMANVVGDKSTAKTALATEALINFMIKFPEGRAAYRETEAAFDQDYAQAMGLKIDQVDFGDPDKPLLTVEDFSRDFEKFLDDQTKAKQPGIYVLDSLDALSDEAEMEADISKGTFGAAKAKRLSTLFRTLARKAERSRVLLLIVSQVRDNIGVMFGEKHRRSGGRAMDFYATQIAWLSHIKTLDKTLNKVTRPIGIRIRAKIKKNKAGLPLRSVDFDFMFGYGVDDDGASKMYLESVGRSALVTADADLKALVRQVWAEVETSFLPKRGKYE